MPRSFNDQTDDETKLSVDPGASITMYVIGIELLKSDTAQMVALGYPIEECLKRLMPGISLLQLSS